MASQLREQVNMHMRLRGFSPRTIESYTHAYVELARHYMRPLDYLACCDIQSFLDFLISVRKLEWSTINVYFSAYRLLYEKILGWDKKRFSIPRRGRSGKRPGILSQDEVKELIRALINVKHRALLAMIYGSGLRVSEAVALRCVHIERSRMMLRVEQGKGHKDRYTILSPVALDLLESHWHKNKFSDYIFYGNDRTKPMSVGTAQAVYYQALEKSGVRKVGGIHVLRHCFATHLMENDVDIYHIKRWMGHRALSTTARYMHVTREHIKKTRSPLDDL